MDRKCLYKSRLSKFDNKALKQEDQRKKLNTLRKSRRTQHFNENRHVEIDPIENEEPVQSKVADRIQALSQFRAQKEAMKKAIRGKSRPPFKVGIPHHGSSPILRELNSNSGKPPGKFWNPQQPQGRITRSRAKSPVKLFPFNGRKTGFNFKLKPLTTPHTPEVLKRSTKKTPKMARKPIMPSKLAKREPKVESSTSSTDIGILAAPLPVPVADVGVDIGSWTGDVQEAQPLTEERASSSAPGSGDSVEREILAMNLQTSSGSSGEFEHLTSTPSIETRRGNKVDRNRTTPRQEPSMESDFSMTTGELQRSRLERESTRLSDLADKWEKIVLQQNLSQDVSDEVDSLVGQTRLLVRDKFNQFRGLVNDFETESATHVVTAEDLDGFWDMMYLQVEKLMKRYTDLDELKNNNWIKSEPPAKKRKGTTKRVQPKVAATSVIREAIQARKAKLASSSTYGEVKEEESSVTNFVPERKSVLVKESRKRSNSPSPYIIMQLSGVIRARSIGQPHNVSGKPEAPNTTPKTIFRETIKTEPRETLKTPGFSVATLQEEATGTSGGTPTQTPRRSIRLMSRLATPATETVCPACSGGLRRSVRMKRLSPTLTRPSPTPKRDETTACPTCHSPLVQLAGAASMLAEAPEPAAVPSTSGRRFVLRPSALDVAHITNLVTSRPDVKTAHAVSPQLLRRSTRKRSSARKVTFHSNNDEKSTMKLPATPYRKSTRGKLQLEPDTSLD